MNLWYNACSANSGVRTINFAAVPVLYIISSFFFYKKEKEQYNQIYMVYKHAYNQIYMVCKDV